MYEVAGPETTYTWPGAQAFSTIRSIQAFRPVGLSKDLLLVGSDSGIVTLLEFQKEHGAIKTVAELFCGKAGCARDVPGQYVAADPSGRAIMAGKSTATGSDDEARTGSNNESTGDCLCQPRSMGTKPPSQSSLMETVT